jgi:hypothetical protein
VHPCGCIGDNQLAGGTGADFSGAVLDDLGYNLIGQSAGSTGLSQSSDILNVNPLLSQLGYHGGTTQTITLQPGSPGIDAGSNALATVDGSPIATDERGYSRIMDGVVDIGAVEDHLFILTIVYGNNQSTTVKTHFSTNLGVELTTFCYEPVEGGIITFTPPASDTSAECRQSD